MKDLKVRMGFLQGTDFSSHECPFCSIFPLWFIKLPLGPEYLLLVSVLLSPNTNFNPSSIILLSEKKQGINLLCFGKI